ncbi:bifunctional UDP-N-acetylglucosamine diphosphorylase/glucosamine-1-phosphate N-acetyltransferase GlmU [Ornithinimicrobium ciconiae]|uniref:Bifunctional protein GlmU n=1 Tax=Ornithinimicrobium ciconiae TaxID=2594265 RepID=A0A516GE33_9MICO|nr:bifunctional UDP-N-acetylglucosamine diphosphorylase/glucosamine-1-phosphate N-acetyltransferase GlmU [Ornithinimicrobium ciconiae]QDO89776.1 bifunctional UDP-N-acetylglucosamine diphosphorylase/glucosamine-1-phosphate N-acetyltransferase GlmU [Ornithinimicrobium ciconiae]
MSENRPAAVIVLAAGEGTRMKSTTPKVLHPIGGRTLVGHAIHAARGTEPAHLAVVVRHQRELVAPLVSEVDPAALIADQDEVKGTGRAVECGLAVLPPDLVGTVLVTYGDVPLLTTATLRALTAAHEESGNAVTVITSVLDDPSGYGRVVRDADGQVVKIVEEKDARAARENGEADGAALDIREINSGIYAFDAQVLRDSLSQIGTDNAQGEKYLTDVLGLARQAGRAVRAHVVEDRWQSEGVNDRVQLATLGRILNERIVEGWMRAGVTVVDPATTWIDADVTVGQDTVIRPGTQLLGATTIGAGAVIGPDTTLTSVEVGDGATVVRTQAELAIIGPGATVGPFSYLRPGTELGARGKIGGFVETKNAVIGEGAKVPHLTYAGDATIGEGANIGAGTIFANYDGVEKHHTTIGRHSFVGSNSVLVAPVDVGDGAYVGAGSAVTSDVDPGQIAVSRARQRNIDGWVARKRPGTGTAEAAEAAGAGRARPTDRTDAPPSGPDQGGTRHTAHESEGGQA